MTLKLSGWMLATIVATTTAAAQAPPTQPPSVPRVPAQPPSTPRSPAPPVDRRLPAAEAAVTVEGCLMREADVPGLKPASGGESGNEYVLTATRMIKGKAPGGAAEMFEVDGMSEAQLKPLVGKRVQIDGTFDETERAGSGTRAVASADDLVEIDGSAIRAATGECPVR